MGTTYIAIDIGASSGRLMKSQLLDGRLSLEEIHRFKNGYDEKNGHKYWDIDRLIQEILQGLAKLKQSGVTTCHIGIDTWGVDYCLLDAEGTLLRQPFCYRDQRTSQAVAAWSKKLSLEALYDKTGIQIQPFNTLFQLLVEDKELLKETDQILLIPDYLGYVLTGKGVMEKTNASTTQLVNSATGQLDETLLSLVGVSSQQLPRMVEAGTELGDLRRADFPEYDLPEAKVITVASHDTASAVAGTPGSGEDWAFISSGTWSLLGAELKAPLISPSGLAANYSNEGGVFQSTRFLKNIMGLWLIQEVARMAETPYSFAELAELAERENFEVPLIDVNDASFLNPPNMGLAIQDYCRQRGLTVPESTGQLALTIYHNLAACYGRELTTLAELTGKTFQNLQIVGGGANARLLNQLTANATGLTVEAGPTEATAIGNILMQMLTTGEIDSLEQGRELIRQSFKLTNYYPERKK
ncbi:rhamnulokinase [Vagococcus sp. BWB3-3]|uniref:Rhamnulokinase n=1 Tax=Vagococcus allomyrinae TaxID=2794353 RepID=A0A940P894_9ENTE|nr:rhamnulokinase [Vagococcus allomyrinae]